MWERVKPTKSGLFTIELLLAVGIFSFCAAICVGIFVRAEVISADNADRVHALSHAKTLSEYFKAAGGDLAQTARLSGGEIEDDGCVVLGYGAEWTEVDPDAAPVFRVELRPDTEEAAAGTVTVWNQAGEILLQWPVAAGRSAP